MLPCSRQFVRLQNCFCDVHSKLRSTVFHSLEIRFALEACLPCISVCGCSCGCKKSLIDIRLRHDSLFRCRPKLTQTPAMGYEKPLARKIRILGTSIPYICSLVVCCGIRTPMLP